MKNFSMKKFNNYKLLFMFKDNLLINKCSSYIYIVYLKNLTFCQKLFQEITSSLEIKINVEVNIFNKIKMMDYKSKFEYNINGNFSASLRKNRKYSDAIEPASEEELIDRFEKSQEVLERIARCEKIIFKKTNEADILFCLHCQIFIDHTKKNICSHCSNIFCDKHKLEIRHNCPKMPKDEKIESFQNAKNIFQMRLKQIKMKAGS
jgi:uncharacterized paraquat-inducible protein A